MERDYKTFKGPPLRLISDSLEQLGWQREETAWRMDIKGAGGGQKVFIADGALLWVTKGDGGRKIADQRL